MQVNFPINFSPKFYRKNKNISKIFDNKIINFSHSHTNIKVSKLIGGIIWIIIDGKIKILAREKSL